MKHVVSAVAAFVVAASVSQAQPTASMSLIHHNIHSGGQAQAAANHIDDLMTMTPQKALVLCNEANNARQYFTLPHPNWHHIWPGSPFEGKGNPSFTRDAAVTLLDSWTLNMTEPWTWNGNNRDPRIYTVVKCQLVNNPWVQFHCINVHFPPTKSADPNGVARQESIDKIIQASQNMPELPLIICGDFNFDEDPARNRIANEIGGRLYSNAKVDHIIVRDGTEVAFDTTVNVTRLGTFISDHQALRYDLSFKLKNKVVDNSDSGFTASANWSTGTSATDKYGSNYRFRTTGAVSDAATWAFDIPVAGSYTIQAWWSQGANRSITAPYILPDSSIVYKNQQANGGSWQTLGTLNLATGTNNVQLSCWTSNGTVVVGDAIRLVPQ